MIDLLLVLLQELSWAPTAFRSSPYAAPCKKLWRSGLVNRADRQRTALDGVF